MNNKPDISERIGTAINELDIDFSQLSFVGWIVSLLSVTAGGGVASLVCITMIRHNRPNLIAGLTFFITIIAVTTIIFLTLRRVVGMAGFSVTKSQSLATLNANANFDTLKRMADSGMDMTSSHTIDFWHLFSTKEAAQSMLHYVRDLGFDSVSVEPNDESGGYDVQVQVELVPTLSTINRMEQILSELAEQHGGHADGWGIKQDS